MCFSDESLWSQIGESNHREGELRQGMGGTRGHRHHRGQGVRLEQQGSRRRQAPDTVDRVNRVAGRWDEGHEQAHLCSGMIVFISFMHRANFY